MRRLLGRAVAIVVLVAAISFAFARPASADICASAPDPVAPKSGLPGMLTMAPKQIPDKTPNPFANKDVSIGQVYGYNWSWSNYDLGCGPNFLRDPIAVTNTQSGNVILSMVGAVLAGLAALEQMAQSSSMSWLSTVIGGIATRLRGPVLSLWLPLAMLGVGLIVAFRARRTSYAETMRTVLIIALAAGMAVFALVFPAVASKTVDKAVVSVSSAAGAEFSASASDAVTRGSAYRAWLTGNFGDPDSADAKQLGPKLMDATHYSWSDMKRIQSDPSAKKQIDAAKAAEFKSVAAQLKQQDPAAYNEFTGRGERMGPAIFGVVVALAMSLFVTIAMIMVLVARMMMQGLALAAPLAAVAGVLPTHRSALSRMWDLFTAALVVVAKFVIAGGVMTMVLGAIESNNRLGAGAQLFWIIVASVVGLLLTRPLHSFKTVVPGLDPNRSYVRTAVNGVTSYFGARLGAEDGAERKDQDEPPTTSLPDQVPTPMASETARESMAALPAPEWSPAESTRVVQLDPPGQRGVPTSQPADRGWPGVVAVPARAELPSPRRQLEVVPDSAVAASTRPDETQSALRQVQVSADETLSQPGSLGADTGSLGADTGSLSLSKGSLSNPTAIELPSTPTNGSEVIYPTGVIVTDDDVPLYRSSEAANGGETYIPMTDPELAADGTEHELVRYHSTAGTAYAA